MRHFVRILCIGILPMIAACDPNDRQKGDADAVTIETTVFLAPTQCSSFDQGCYDKCVAPAESVYRDLLIGLNNCLAACAAENDPDILEPGEDPNDPNPGGGSGLSCEARCTPVDEDDVNEARRDCRQQCTVVEETECGECVESLDRATTMCTREVPDNVVVVTNIRVGCEQADMWEARGWECGACIAPHPIAKEIQYQLCQCGETRWLNACGDQPLFSSGLNAPD